MAVLKKVIAILAIMLMAFMPAASAYAEEGVTEAPSGGTSEVVSSEEVAEDESVPETSGGETVTNDEKSAVEQDAIAPTYYRVPTINCDPISTRVGRWETRAWTLKATLGFKHCGTYDVFRYVTYTAKRNGAGNPCSDGAVEKFNFNWGAYGTWNPPMRSIECTHADITSKTVYPDEQGSMIYHSSNDRCARLYIKYVVVGGDDDDFTSSRKCLS